MMSSPCSKRAWDEVKNFSGLTPFSYIMSNYVKCYKDQVGLTFIPTGISDGPRFGMKQVYANIRTWIGRSRQRQHLAELDSRLLNDVGLTAEQVEHEISKPFWVK